MSTNSMDGNKRHKRMMTMRAKGLSLGQQVLHHSTNCKVTSGCYLYQVEKDGRE